jgi:uncharacterized protein YdaU (DUF1376 family)
MHYYKFNIADWHLATSHLSLLEEVVYFKLINFYYDTELPIPVETETVIRRLRLKSNLAIFKQILQEFFVLQDDGWHHQRCDIEISKYHSKAEVNREVGKLGGRPKKTNDLDNPQITQTVSEINPQITLTTNQELRTNINTYTQEFELFWKSYPRHEAKSAAMKAFKKVKVDINILLKAVAQQKTSKQWQENIIPHASTWLNQSRWEDEITAKPTNDIFSPQRTTA